MRRLLSCRRGSALVGYTSLMLLFAVAVIAVFGHASSSERLRHTSITSD